MSGHTPGPWLAFTPDGRHVQAPKWEIVYDDLGGLEYAPIKAGDKVVAFAVSRSRDYSRDLNVAPDCRLIAATPELLAALQMVNAQCPDDIGTADDGAVLIALTVVEVKALRALIAKATGATA